MNKFSTSEIKILVVDDRPENLLVLQAVFRKSGYILIEALSGKSALEQAAIHDFACILLDVQMPLMDGFETAKAFRRMPKTESTPIIFMTAIHRSEEYEFRGYIAGAVDYLFKPFDTNILLAKVQVFVDLYRKTEELKLQKSLLEEALQKSQENEQLKKALLARDEFLTMATHELKTPITPLSLQMQTFIHLFETDTYATIEKERILRMLYTSQAQVERLSRLIHELVDVSKLTLNKLEIARAEVDLDVIVKKILQDFEPEIRKSGSVIHYNGAAKVIGFWDSFRIEQIIINLLTNALKYGLGKPIFLTVAQTNCAVFKISDGGIGIESKSIERIFERFERAAPSASFSGLGLGLYIAKSIVELHGGKISVESTPGIGSTFKVELPLLEMTQTPYLIQSVQRLT